MTNKNLAALSAHGVSVWLDDLSRERIASGQLASLIDSHAVVGVTTNPTIFAGAISAGHSYDEQLRQIAADGGDAELASTVIPSDDVRAACDVLRGVYDATDGQDGRVSIEVDPRLARETDPTIEQAKHLWSLVDRPNVMIKIPATLEGLPAITAATAAGISVNVTLIFSPERYQAVVDAYLTGLEQAQAAGIDLSTIRSVASVFVSRVDGIVDGKLDELGTPEAAALRGKVAIANARVIYGHFLRLFAGERWDALAAAGAHKQRPLWASTGVKDPAYPDTMYVDELVAADTVNTMPEKTMNAVADHGVIAADTITGALDEAEATLAAAAELGIDLGEVAQFLENDGVAKFEASWGELLQTLQAGLDRAS